VAAVEIRAGRFDADALERHVQKPAADATTAPRAKASPAPWQWTRAELDELLARSKAIRESGAARQLERGPLSADQLPEALAVIAGLHAPAAPPDTDSTQVLR
jgi:hypothetical protein